MESVSQDECKERRDNIKESATIKVEGIQTSHDIFRWILSTFLVIYFIVLGFSLQRIIDLEAKVQVMSSQLTMIHKYVSYDLRDRVERSYKNDK